MNLILLAAAFLIFSCRTPVANQEQPTSVGIAEYEAFPVKEVKAQLGEGAIWNPQTKTFWWVDIEGMSFFILNPSTGEMIEYPVGQRIGTIVPTKTGSAVVALQDGIYDFNLETSQMTPIASPEAAIADIRFNDGKCDPTGSLWVGSMKLNQSANEAALYRVDPNGNAVQMLDSVTISNGICWSLDEKTMYYIDTPKGNVRAFDYDKTSQTISNERVVVAIADSLGYPDGMTIDSEGMLWIGHWNGNMVGRWDPTSGKLIGKVNVPAHNVTACAFGGKNLDTLFITTARVDMSEDELLQKPLSGSVFAAVPGVKGVETYFFGK